MILLLGWMGLAERKVLERNRRYALVACALLGAVLTPADVVSMLLLFVPLYLLYELGIILLRIAPANRVAEGSVVKSAVKDAMGRNQSDSDNDQGDAL